MLFITGRKHIFALIGAVSIITCQIYAQPQGDVSQSPPSSVVIDGKTIPVIRAGGDSAAKPAPRPGSEAVTQPPPPSGSRDGFFYAPDKSQPGMTVVYPTNGSEPIHVSTNFANFALKSGTDKQVLQRFESYEVMTAEVGNQFMEHFFPDSTNENANIQESVIQGTDRDVIIKQDPMAGPYARVTITDKEGNVLSEMSMSGKAIMQIVNSEQFSADKKIEMLGKPDFILPENIRQYFDEMTSPQLHALIRQKPALAKQEFVKVAKAQAAARADQAGDSEITTGIISAPAETAGERTDRQSRTTTRSLDSQSSAEPLSTGITPETQSSDPAFQWSLIIAGFVAVIAVGAFIWALLRFRD